MHVRFASSSRRLTLIAAAAACAAGTAHAGVVLNYASFNNACGTTLTCVGNTAETGGRLRLTDTATIFESGGGFSQSAIALGSNASFSTRFQFQITNPGGLAPADGFTFVLAAGPSGLGSSGSGMGYGGVQNSVAIEFDTFNNGGGDGNSSNHVGVDTNGSLNSAALANPYGRTTCDFNGGTRNTDFGCMSNGDIWTVFINYDGALLDVSLQDGAGTLVSVINRHAIDIAAVLGTTQAFAGFTSATGAGYANHDILNWTLANDASIGAPNAVPEPGSLALAGLALGGAGLARRRKR